MKLIPVLAAALGILTLNSSFALAEYRGDHRHRQEPGYQGSHYQAPGYQGSRYAAPVYQSQYYQNQHYQGQGYPGQHYPGQHYQGPGYQGQGYPGQGYQGQGYYRQSYGPSYQLQPGEYVDRGRWDYAQRVDYHYHRLSPPPRGYEWRSYDGSWVLAALATGLIVEILINGR